MTTVQELIDQLKRYPSSARVVVDGYEGGKHDIGEPELIKINLNVNKCPSIYGDHEKVEQGVYDCEAVYIP